ERLTTDRSPDGPHHERGRDARQETPRARPLLRRGAPPPRPAPQPGLRPLRRRGARHGRVPRLQPPRHLRDDRRERQSVGRPELLEEGGGAAREVAMEPEDRARARNAPPRTALARGPAAPHRPRPPLRRRDRAAAHPRRRLVVPRLPRPPASGQQRDGAALTSRRAAPTPT